MKKIGVILSGCGVYDGSEIHEAVLTLLAISRSGAQAVCFAPDKQQVDVINHLTGEAMTETRNVLIEAARITRGEIRPLAQADAAELGCRRIGAGGKNLQIRRHPRRVCQIQLLPGEDARRLIRQGVVNLKIPVLLGGCQRSAGNQRIGQPHICQRTLSHNPLGKPRRLRLAADGKLRLRAPGPCRYRPDPRAVHGTGPIAGGIRFSEHFSGLPDCRS